MKPYTHILPFVCKKGGLISYATYGEDRLGYKLHRGVNLQWWWYIVAELTLLGNLEMSAPRKGCYTYRGVWVDRKRGRGTL